MKAYLVRIFLCLLTCALVGGVAAARTIEFETTQVTEADVTVSPDGQWLIFTMLGHLFHLPVEGGTAEQLTFGPYYDTDPIFSPDGTRVAFVSDRDGSEGNVFVLELASEQITQITQESWAARPEWSPDGQAIVYLSFARDLAQGTPETALWVPIPALVKRHSLRGGEPETLDGTHRLYRSVFYLPDGRLGWAVVERGTVRSHWTTRIEIMDVEGRIATSRTVKGYVDRVVASPSGDGVYCRHFLPLLVWQPGHATEHLVYIPLLNGHRREILPVSASFWAKRFAVSADNKNLYLSHAGRLWKVALPSGFRQRIAFNAGVRLEVQDPVSPPKWAPVAAGSSAPPRSILNPRLSPDGSKMVFESAGYLWQQLLDGGPAQQLFEGSAFESNPAFSPDGKYLAFVRDEHGKQEVRVFNFASEQMRTLPSGWVPGGLSWSPDAQRLIFAEYAGVMPHVVAVNLSDGKKEVLLDRGGGRMRPHLSADGQSLNFTANLTGTWMLYRLPVNERAKPEPVTRLAEHLRGGLISPDGKWLAFRRGMGIWVAPLGSEPVKEEDVRNLSPEGGDDFAFTPDSSAVIYAVGNRVWQHPLEGGEREEIPIRLELQTPTPPPLLLRRVHLLDFESGAFGRETSLFIENGRIRWIGSERNHRHPPQTVILDTDGRFAVPGFFDMHVHLRAISHDAFLAYGVTSVRDTGDSLAWLNALADRSETTGDALPRYFFSGDVFMNAQLAARVQIHNEDEARAYVRRWKEWGAHFIKAYDTLSWTLQRVVAKEARHLSLPVVGHGMFAEHFIRRVKLGYAILEHSSWSTRLYDDVLQMLAYTGTRWDPTLTMYGGTILTLRDEPERLNDAKVKAFMPEWCATAAFASGFMKVVGDKPLRGDWIEQLGGVLAAHRRGVKLHAGTDVQGAGWVCFPGLSLHWELEHLVEAGIEPLEVLRIATQEAAEAVGAEDDLGTLEAGKLADIVLLDANPLDDIKNTQTIWRVIKGGWLFDPEKLRPPVSTSPDDG